MLLFFFFNDTATTEIYTLSLHDALRSARRRVRSTPDRSMTENGVASSGSDRYWCHRSSWRTKRRRRASWWRSRWPTRSEEHTSELQSRQYLVCRLLLEKKKTHIITSTQ